MTGKLGNATIDGSGDARPEPRRVPRATPSAARSRRSRSIPARASCAWSGSSPCTTWGGSSTRSSASSQAEGGVIQGIGYALSEELVVDPTTGIPVNGHLDDYKVPTIADMPEIVVDFVDVPDANLPNLGAKGLGEPPIVPTAAAIANAFAHATGRRAAALPLTPARVLEALA